MMVIFWTRPLLSSSRLVWSRDSPYTRQLLASPAQPLTEPCYSDSSIRVIFVCEISFQITKDVVSSAEGASGEAE